MTNDTNTLCPAQRELLRLIASAGMDGCIFYGRLIATAEALRARGLVDIDSQLIYRATAVGAEMAQGGAS